MTETKYGKRPGTYLRVKCSYCGKWHMSVGQVIKVHARRYAKQISEAK